MFSALSFEFVTNVPQTAKTLIEGKAAVATVGDLYQLPYAEEIGLKI